ncbi:PepSY domain-containing protein [Alteromonas lipolytica]|uniref:2Fe-2S ferredoxin-type domain-containing protein n=1 Tax=Alteromonas lipolytica TaxID=1856405 RepID=A0A1E8FFZ7_9ALTE|nr:PepSY domain-containing protein [Alteromonas lipolytica]OFI34844.1 hypothetical protein BFC17_14820 [Alteromonas lipolytica]GGF54447.1 hypothetical protein GCM10011338_03310 [Alteromonas lipolytica]
MRLVIALWHKWLALIVGIQLLIWLGTGLYFNSLMDSAANITTRQAVQHEAYLPGIDLFPLNQLQAPAPIAAKVIWVLGNPYYALYYNQPSHNYFKQERLLFDARSGKSWQITPALVSRIASLAYSGDASAQQPRLLSPPIEDLPRQQNPLWQVNFNDDLHTSVYLDALTGHVVKYTNDNQRFDDLMFTLHFMDYTGTGSFNHWLIIAFATMTAILSLSGGYLLLKRSVITKSSKTGSHHTLQVSSTSSPEIMTLTTPPDTSIFNALARQAIHLPSECGGGGTCGKCILRCSPDAPVSEAERFHLSSDQLKAGYRLGCQQLAGDNKTISLL